MAVQRKSQKNPPGEKKPVNWTKVIVIGFIVLVVVMCVVSFSGVPTAIGNLIRGNPGTDVSEMPIEEGDHVGVQFATITNNEATFLNFKTENDTDSLYRITVKSDSNITTDDYKSFVVKVGDEAVPYKITAAEQNAIMKAIVGNNYGVATMVGIETTDSDLYECKKTDLEAAGYDISTLKVGDTVLMTFPYTDENGDAKKYARYGVITKVADDFSSATLNFGSDSVMVRVVEKYAS